MRKFLHVSTVADELACSRKHVYQLVQTGSLEAVNISNKGDKISYRISRESVDSFLANNIVLPL